MAFGWDSPVTKARQVVDQTTECHSALSDLAAIGRNGDKWTALREDYDEIAEWLTTYEPTSPMPLVPRCF